MRKKQQQKTKQKQKQKQKTKNKKQKNKKQPSFFPSFKCKKTRLFDDFLLIFFVFSIFFLKLALPNLLTYNYEKY